MLSKEEGSEIIKVFYNKEDHIIGQFGKEENLRKMKSCFCPVEF